MTNDRQERIRNRAHQIWLQEGQPAGQHDRHWHQATADVEQEDSAGKTAAKKPAKKAAGAGKEKAAAKEAKATAKATKPKKAAK